MKKKSVKASKTVTKSHSSAKVEWYNKPQLDHPIWLNFVLIMLLAIATYFAMFLPIIFFFAIPLILVLLLPTIISYYLAMTLTGNSMLWFILFVFQIGYLYLLAIKMNKFRRDNPDLYRNAIFYSIFFVVLTAIALLFS
ncbi:hypothetical protein HY989_04765 [Candidatus Micrarchaeota archaeon]|nr:hypothetical protein [Candidatus Micrarchaeota archaeon]